MKDSNGIISFGDYHCEHGNSEPCRFPENFSICFPQAIHDFSRLDWFREHSLEVRLQLLLQPLQGIHEMHEKGIMHRDITVGNMLILSYDSPRAVISDFGKAIHAQNSHETCIGPISTLAPEVWSATTYNPYDKAVDIWAYGYAIAQILRCVNVYKSNNNIISKEKHADILGNLDLHAAKFPKETELIKLVKSMLIWDAQQRIAAQLALDHPCWDDINRGSKRNIEDDGLEGSKRQAKASVSHRTVHDDSYALSQTQSFGSQTQMLLAKRR